MRKRSRQQYRMKERQNRDEFEIRKAKRGHGADQRGIVGGLERETVPGTEVVASHPERRKQKQGRGGQVLIESDWNLKEHGRNLCQSEADVLIESDWNLKFSGYFIDG